MSCDILIRPATPADAAAMAAIYNPYVLNSTISFEEEAVTVEEMVARLDKVTEQGLPWLVAELNGELLGYAYATRWRVRPAYRYAVETSVYFAPEARGQGLGGRLYRSLLQQLRSQGLHLAIAGIALPNAASIALHQGLGFEQAATFHQVGWKAARWLDVAYWELRLNEGPPAV
ncbi:arsinothricin resistance N-acetyltransferase ArsN1 family B [Aquitalea sp. LB_tupeE]|uniref:arsinothricin resistance N-acetyltransferase ArsN1 family B n=1 Tax=Aquitalea sp. LB_tupeE TaxID=2748078 RepID=UPI0015BA3229|nr:arsinothricin resistance N-acetyltransferase ArsN1 family B [Aquitalea sp. LB_tupeE]NWK77535.1 N-acetyltransferase family protein [Aquitalea sp. LB_tupeE]